MEFSDYIAEQLSAHPAMQPQDLCKLCYQAAHGAEHLLSDPELAAKYLYAELDRVTASDKEPLVESISPEICRVNLRAWKAAKLPREWLLQLFLAAAHQVDGTDRLSAYLEIAGHTAQQVGCGFTRDEWDAFLSDYTAAGMPALHHSDRYRAAEQPAYRLMRSECRYLLPVLQEIAALPDTGKVQVVAIDGRAASGKSTLAAYLRQILGAPVVHMDDFFLPPAMRSAERLAEPGGNLHYERFMEEVLPHLAKPAAFSYRIFDCGCMDYNGTREVASGSVRIVEGSYSCHPLFGDYAALRLFCQVDPDEQMRRILRRNGDRLAAMFRDRWIPMEERYFSAFAIPEKAVRILCPGAGKDEKNN